MKTRIWRALAGGAAGTLFLGVATAAGPAFPSDLATGIVDATSPTGEVELAPGATGTFTITLTVTGNQAGTATFKVNKNWVLTGGAFSGSNPETFTVPPRAGGDPATVFTRTGQVTVAAGHAAGSNTLTIQAFDLTNSNNSGGKLAVGTGASYVVKVAAPADTTPPVITPNVSGTLGNNGWYTSDVNVTWTVTDAESSYTSSGCGPTTISGDTAGTTLTCSATSGGGNASQSVQIKRDATAPIITATPSADPNGAGFNNSAVDVSYSCSDATSGVAGACPATDHATTDGTHTFTHTIFDNAGNSAAANTTVELDATAPTIFGSAAPAANAAGWNNSDVTVTFTCLDSGSGVKSCVADGSAPAADNATLSSEGAGQSVSGTATDNADNTNSVTVDDINIDKTPPVIQYVSRTPANGEGWNDSDVTVTWSCSDAGGSGPVTATVTQTLSSEGSNQSVTGTCADVAGNTASDTQDGISIDKSAPGIVLFDRSPAPNGHDWNNSDVTVTWTCSDSVSQAVNGAVAEAVSTEGANQSVTGTCEDLAGNTASDTQNGINIDKTAPGATISAVPDANAAGWYNAPFTAGTSGTDSLSGIDFCSDDQTYGDELDETDTSAGQLNGTCTDKAGNVSDPAVLDFKYDASKPAAPTAAVVPAPNGAGWNNSLPVTVTFTDNGDAGPSGVVDCTDDVQVIAETAGTAVSGSCTDAAGNTSDDASVTVMVEVTKPNAPALAADRSPEHGVWFKDSVTVSSTSAGDVGAVQSGVDAGTLEADHTFSTSGTHTVTDRVEDVADNESDEASLTVKVDATKPVVSLTCPNQVVLGSTASATWSASDAHSGVAGSGAGSIGLDTSSVGPKTGTVPAGAAQDNVGHGSAAETCTYSVVYGWDGFLQPINDTAHTGMYESKFKLGSTVPVKFVIKNNAGASVQSSTLPQFQVSGNRGSCDTVATQESIPDSTATTGTAFRWSDNQYIFNFSTKGKTAGEYRVWATGIDDGMNHYVDICLTK